MFIEIKLSLKWFYLLLIVFASISNIITNNFRSAISNYFKKIIYIDYDNRFVFNVSSFRCCLLKFFCNIST